MMEGLETHADVDTLSVCVPVVFVFFSKFFTRLLISCARVISSACISVVDASPQSDRDLLLVPLSLERSGDLLLNERLSSDLRKSFKFTNLKKVDKFYSYFF